MPSTKPLIHALPASTTTQETTVPDLHRPLTHTSLDPRLDIAFTDPAASAAAGPASDASAATTDVTTHATRMETAMPPTTPLVHPVSSSTPTTAQEITMPAHDRSFTPDPSPSTPHLDISLPDPVATAAAEPANDARDTSPPASAERVTNTGDSPRSDEPPAVHEHVEPEDRLEYAEEQLNWLHSASASDPHNAERRAALLGCLERLTPADRGIVERRYDRRVLSPLLAEWLYLSTALVVGVHCGAVKLESHVEAFERMSVAHLEGLVRSGRTRPLDRLQRRAGDRFDKAVEAFAAIVVPRRRSHRATPTTPTMGDAAA